MRRVYQVPHVSAHKEPPATFETRQQRRAAERAAQKTMAHAANRQAVAKKKRLRAESKRQEMLRD